MSFNKACRTGRLSLEILSLKPAPSLLTVQFRLNLADNTETNSCTSSKLKEFVLILTAW
jgi:hypothetical protein